MQIRQRSQLRWWSWTVIKGFSNNL